MKFKLRQGDNLELLKKLPDNSIDSVVTDPPYALTPRKGAKSGFMGKLWDADVPSVELWKEVYRVLKPGGHLLSFGGTRTYHRMVVNIEDAGFEIRDQIMWLYGSGFPKSHNIGKAVDATIKTGKSNPKSINQSEMTKTDGEVVEVLQPNNGILGDKKMVTKTIGASLETKEAQQYEGWGTALKPANEPICVARKPLSEKSVAENVLKWGTGGINIDGCRIGSEVLTHKGAGKSNIGAIGGSFENGTKEGLEFTSEGRFPANIILDEIAGEMLDEQSVSASRFFYQAKVSKKERNMGLDGFEDKLQAGAEFRPNHMEKALRGEDGNPYGRYTPTKNVHPTVKPVNLMAYLCRLITPQGGTILDPYMGSGSTGIAALLEGFNFIGMDLDPEYVKIAEARISDYENYREFLK